MARNQSTQVERNLGPALTLADLEFAFTVGECILVRIPEQIEIYGNIDSEEDEATASSRTGLPLTSNGQSPQYLAFIRQGIFQPKDGSYLLEVYPVVSFSATYNTMDDDSKAILLPLPPLSHRHPTPKGFGAPIQLGNWSDHRDSWLRVVPTRFVLPRTRPFKRFEPPLIMSLRILERIELYREHLGHHDNQNPSSPNDRSGNVMDDSVEEKVAEVKQENLSVNTSRGILVLEGVDEDAEGPDATALDELKLMAHDDPMWMKELQKYLREEEKEREEMQEEREARLARWREGISIQPS